jgi:hypothetical protein
MFQSADHIDRQRFIESVSTDPKVDARELEELLDCFAHVEAEELLIYARTFVHATLYITAIRAVFSQQHLLTQVSSVYSFVHATLYITAIRTLFSQQHLLT